MRRCAVWLVGVLGSLLVAVGHANAVGVWGQATPAVFAAGVQNTNPNASFSSVSCGSVGNCTAVGRFKNVVGGIEAFTMTSVDDTPAPTTTAAPTLPATGSEVNGPFVAGLLALVAGVMVTLLRRRSIN